MLLLILFFAFVVRAEEYWNVIDVPNTRLESDMIHISDPDDWVTVEYEHKINSVLDSLRSFDGADVFVVVLSSIGDASIEVFATDLFNTWGIGDAQRDDGLLLLMVEDQHNLRFEVGYGLEDDLPDAVCMRIFQDIIVPYFKQSYYSEGLYAGVCAVAERLGYRPDDSEVSVDQIAALSQPVSGYQDSGSDFEMDGPTWAVIVIYLVLALALMVYTVRQLIVDARKLNPNGDEDAASKAFKSLNDNRLMVVLMCILCCPMLPIAILYLIVVPILKRRFRSAPRICSCGHEMRHLSEAEEDAFMTKNQIFEESLGVKDVDVWLCDACGEKRVFQMLKAKARSYVECPSCKCLACKVDYDTTITKATTSHSGTGLHHYVCKKCGYRYTKEFVIPKISTSSSSSSGGHHSSGGSFGGGHSGGGGHTGHW